MDGRRRALTRCRSPVLADLPVEAPVPPPTDPSVDGEGRVPSPRQPGGVFAEGPAGVSSRRLEVADRAYWRLCDLAADAPVLLVLDDAQWLDEATLQLACYLAHRIEDTGLSLVVAADDRVDEARDRLLDDLAHAPVARRCDLRPLSPGATRALLHAALSPEAADAYAAACHQAAGGNPQLTAELAEELRRTGAGPPTAGAALVAQLRPPRVARSVAGRLAWGLDPERPRRAPGVVVALRRPFAPGRPPGLRGGRRQGSRRVRLTRRRGLAAG